jgi:hypothetical protein
MDRIWKRYEGREEEISHGQGKSGRNAIWAFDEKINREIYSELKPGTLPMYIYIDHLVEYRAV